MIGKKVIIRADRAGVFYGVLKEKNGSEVTLTDCRRLWCWYGAASISQLGRFGSLNHSSKVIIQYSLTGVPIQEYGSTREASRVTKINQGTIAACARGERASAGSYKWRYK